MRLVPALLLCLSGAPAAADPVVVELFTSQGCSSCPPADTLLGELAGRDDVIALSLHVDYWDWIGWTDTFGDPLNSARQRAYAAAADTSVVYTPQFVIGGSDVVAGPSGMDLAEVIAAHKGATGDVLRAEGDALLADNDGVPARLALLEVLPEAHVPVLHGENAGHQMSYHNVVRAWRPLLPDWDGTAMRLDLPPATVEGARRVVLAQTVTPDGHPGAMAGAVVVD
jgi:hypothetical protein